MSKIDKNPENFRNFHVSEAIKFAPAVNFWQTFFQPQTYYESSKMEKIRVADTQVCLQIPKFQAFLINFNRTLLAEATLW